MYVVLIGKRTIPRLVVAETMEEKTDVGSVCKVGDVFVVHCAGGIAVREKTYVGSMFNT